MVCLDEMALWYLVVVVVGVVSAHALPLEPTALLHFAFPCWQAYYACDHGTAAPLPFASAHSA